MQGYTRLSFKLIIKKYFTSRKIKTIQLYLNIKELITNSNIFIGKKN